MKRSGQYGWMGVLCLILLGMSSPLFAKVVYVSPNGNDLQDGLSWAKAKRTVTAALRTALPGDQIWVRYGVYQERITLKNGVSLYGGFRGNESTLSERPSFPRPQPDPYETVLDGGQGGSVVTSPDTANRAYRLDGFTIRNGSAEVGGGLYLTTSATLLTVANCTISGNSTSKDGGGVYCTNNSSPTLTGCTISGNSASNTGGGVACYDNSSPTLTGCTIAYNSAGWGGGVYCRDNSSPTLSGCTISDNSATNRGGGVRCNNSSPTLSECTISGNSASYGGGVACYDNSSPTLTGCTISGNSASNNGGGVDCYDYSSPTLSECIIVHNSAGWGGGVYCLYNSSPTLSGCTIANNSAQYGGGVACYDYSSPTLSRCTISGNSASSGGGVYCYWSSPTLTGCTIVYNSASSGGGVACYVYSSPTLTGCTVIYNMAAVAGGIWTDNTDTRVRNTILAFNAGGGISAPALSVFRHNCAWGNIPYNLQGDIGNPIGRDGNISADPLLVAGHLLPDSPCIDAGDNSVVGTSTDIDGEARIGNGTVDIGADEFHAPIVQGYLLFNDFGASLPLFMDWEIRAGGVQTRTLLLDPDGGFVVANVPARQFALSVKPLTHLRRTVEVDTSGGSVLGLMVSLTNGDIDGDNEVTLFDFGRLVAAFGSTSGDENWDARADLDGDGEVTLFDFGVLVRNFGEIGDD